MAIKFNKYNVTDTATKAKARVFYSLDNRVDGRKVVTMYAKDYGGALGAMFADSYINDTDSQTDYFDQGRVCLFEGHPMYAQARSFVEALQAARA